MAIQNFTEDHMVSIEPGGGNKSDEKLRSVCVRTRVGHRQQMRPAELQLEILIFKSGPVDALTTSPVLIGDVASLRHELRDDPVENTIFISEHFA